MNPNDDTLERVLRHAPSPQPPRDLKDRLIAGITLPASQPTGAAPAADLLEEPARWDWLRTWWPTAAAASVALAVCGALAYQHDQIAALQQQVEAIEKAAKAPTPAPAPAPVAAAVPVGTSGTAGSGETIEGLRRTVAALNADIARLQTLATENDQLRRTATGASTLTEAEMADLKSLQDQAFSVRCINNLKQLGLAARVWATDNSDVLPPDILSMTNEMATPKILVCPADTRRQAADNWASWSAASNCSYEHLAASGTETEPQRVLFRCPVHGHVTLCDGSVQARVAIEHPEWFVIRDGKLFLEH